MSPAGNLLASASTDGSLVVLDVRAWRVVMRFKGSTPLMSASFLPPRAGGCCVAAAGQDGNLWGFDLAPGAPAAGCLDGGGESRCDPSCGHPETTGMRPPSLQGGELGDLYQCTALP